MSRLKFLPLLSLAGKENIIVFFLKLGLFLFRFNFVSGSHKSCKEEIRLSLPSSCTAFSQAFSQLIFGDVSQTPGPRDPKRMTEA